MYAVIKAGGKQHKVKAGDVIEVELMHGVDEKVTFSPILVVDDDGKAHVGKDLSKAAVTAKLVGEQKGEKIKVFKYRPKSGYQRRAGHRQMYTLVEIEDVTLGAKRAPAKKPAPKPEKAEPKPDAATPKAETAELKPEAVEPEEPTAGAEDAAAEEAAAGADAPAGP